MAVSFASLSTAFAWGALLLAVVAVVAGFAWGKIVTRTAEREAREMAEAEVRKWLKDEALPILMREVSEFLTTFRGERPISEEEVNAMVAAAGTDAKEGDDGKK